MNIKRVLTSAIFFLFQLHSASASFISQDTIPPGDSSKVHEFDFSIEYGSTRLYRGIKSSSHPYLRPSFVYASPSGFYAGVTSYFPLDSGKVDETDVSAGYEFSLSKRTEISFELTHYFINNNQLANALVRNGVELYLRHDFGKILKSRVYADADFGKVTTDYSLTLDNSLEFVFEDAFTEDAKLSIIPALSITAGTLNLVRKIKKDVVSTGFALTNYDLSLGIEYEVGRFIIEPEAAYDFPVDRKTTLLQKTVKSDPVFYFTASITFVLD